MDVRLMSWGEGGLVDQGCRALLFISLSPGGDAGTVLLSLL